MGNQLKLISLQCPHCNATLEVQDGLDTYFCNYCGNKIMMEGVSDAAYNAKVRIKEMEHKEKLKAMESEEDKRSNRSLLIFSALVLAFPLAIFIPSWIGYSKNAKESSQIAQEQEAQQSAKLQQIESQLIQALKNEDYDTALICANQLHYSGTLFDPQISYWNEKREGYIKLIEEKKAEKGESGNSGK